MDNINELPTAQTMRDDWVYSHYYICVNTDLRKNWCENQVRVKLDDPYGASKMQIRDGLDRVIQELRDKGFNVDERTLVNATALQITL